MSQIKPLYTCYAIRQISTGKFLPMNWSSNRGHSFKEPSFDFPRLFRSKRSAQAALSAWLRGEWKDPEYEYDEDFHHNYLVGYSPIPKQGRDKNDMEIVPIDLMIGQENF